MNRLFDNFFGRPAGLGVVERVWAPAMDMYDMYETKDDLVVTFELPGVKEKEIHVSITNDILTIKGERTQSQEVKDENYHHVWSAGTASSSATSRSRCRSRPTR